MSDKNKKLVIDNITVRFPGLNDDQETLALKEINLTINPQEFVVAIGASGCGKTTLLNIIAGFLKPNTGRIYFKDNAGEEKDITKPGSQRGVVFQKHALLPWLNVHDNVAFGLKLQKKLANHEIEEIVTKNLDLVGLKDFKNHKVYQISGGMQQRVGIARALAADPDMLLMDEPLGALDALTRENLQELILKVWADSKKMVFFITHSVEEALFMATKLIIMSPRPGRIEEVFDVNFSKEFFNGKSSRDIKSEPKFVKMREKILNIIYQYEEKE